MWQCINLGELCDIYEKMSESPSLSLPTSLSLSPTHTCNGTHRIKLKGKMCILTDQRANIRYCCIRTRYLPQLWVTVLTKSNPFLAIIPIGNSVPRSSLEPFDGTKSKTECVTAGWGYEKARPLLPGILSAAESKWKLWYFIDLPPQAFQVL